jgi:hypothetical protein
MQGERRSECCQLGNAGIPMAISKNTNLPEEADLIVEQVLLYYLAVLPMRDSAKLQLERFAGGIMHPAVQPFPRADHLALPASDGARPVA